MESAAAPTEAPSRRVAFCTVATASHCAAALGMLKSLQTFHPAATPVLMMVDAAPTPAIPDGIRVLRIEDCMPAPLLADLRRRYTAAELCFAAKPYLLAAVLKSGADQAHYLDGDCLTFSALTPLIEQLQGADLLLTPHSLSPIPDDGLSPRPLTLLRGGVFNGGYIGVRDSEQGRAFLSWLGAMTASHGYNRPKEGMCGDQRWLDLVPVLFPGAAICRHVGANVAYWNLHERSVGIDSQGRYHVAGAPLLFFHFSGFDPAQPQQLSRYQNRHAVVTGSALARVLGDYRAALAAYAAPARGGRWSRLLRR